MMRQISVIIVSHDRWFVENVVKEVYYAVRSGRIEELTEGECNNML
jgi:ATPase subunit of ABC transporter with duplicated ATPase domains